MVIKYLILGIYSSANGILSFELGPVVPRLWYWSIRIQIDTQKWSLFGLSCSTNIIQLRLIRVWNYSIKITASILNKQIHVYLVSYISVSLPTVDFTLTPHVTCTRGRPPAVCDVAYVATRRSRTLHTPVRPADEPTDLCLSNSAPK